LESFKEKEPEVDWNLFQSLTTPKRQSQKLTIDIGTEYWLAVKLKDICCTWIYLFYLTTISSIIFLLDRDFYRSIGHHGIKYDFFNLKKFNTSIYFYILSFQQTYIIVILYYKNILSE